MDIDTKNIEQLLIEKKYDEVRKIITELTSAKFSDEEKGAVLVGISSIYLDISNAINANYRDALKEVIASMKEIDKAENSVSEKIKLEEVRRKLNN